MLLFLEDFMGDRNVDLFLSRIRSVGSVQYDIVPARETTFRLELRTEVIMFTGGSKISGLA